MSPYLTKQEGIYSVILPIYNVAYNRARVFSLQIFLSPLSPTPLEVLIAAYCCFATPSMSTPAISVAPTKSVFVIDVKNVFLRFLFLPRFYVF